MKLRNKKTGEIVDFQSFQFYQRDNCKYPSNIFESLSALNKEWEDYTPAEPLIKDEKIRKAVRAWWETIPDAVTDKRVLYKNNHDFAVGIYSIYCGEIYPETLEVGKMYTITELCGEEEE